MDPISASTTALSVIGTAIKVGRETYILVQGARTAPAHIQRLATEMQGLYNLLATIQRLLEKNHTQNDQIIMDMLENLETILHDCIEVFKDVKKTINPFLDSHGEASAGRWRGFLWATFKKDDVMALQQTLGSYRAMLNMSFSALSVVYASHTDDVVVKIDENTSQIKGNLENMQSDASRIDTRLKVLQKAVKRLERHLDDQEREELLGEGEAQGDQDVDPIDSPSANNRPESNRTSVASYNSSLRRSLRDLGSIISSSSAMSRMPSMLISAVPESAEQHPSQKGGLVSAQEEGGDGALEDDEKYRAFIETVASLKIDEDPDSELSTTPTFQENSPDLGDLDDNHTGRRIGFDMTSEGHDWDSEAANPSTISPCGALEALQLLPRPPDDTQNPRPPPLPSGQHRRQVPESAIETIQKLEPLTPAMALVAVADLKNRVENWKGHKVENFGDLLLNDILVITRGTNSSDRLTYHIYLFERILLCCKPNNSKIREGLWISKKPETSSLQGPLLLLKGRIFMKNVTRVIPYSTDWQYAMQLFFKGVEQEENISVYFDDQGTMDTWVKLINLQSEANKPTVEDLLASFGYTYHVTPSSMQMHTRQINPPDLETWSSGY